MVSKYKKIVDCFSRGEKKRLHQMLYLCRSLKDFVYGIELNQNGKRCVRCCIPVCPNDRFSVALSLNAHQRRIPQTVLNNFYSQVKSLSFSRKFKDFEELYDYVATNSGLSKKHCLLVYDFCLRKGYHLNPQILPKKYVYLFQGAKECAKVILGKTCKGYKLPTKTLQCVLKTRMKSYEIEHLLCVCRPHLEAI